MTEQLVTEQLEHAFARAEQARAAIASIVDAVAAGELDLEGAFGRADDEPLVGRCFAVKVFEVVPGVGKVRARRTMAEIGLPEDIWLGDVSLEQRREIATALAADHEPRGRAD